MPDHLDGSFFKALELNKETTVFLEQNSVPFCNFLIIEAPPKPPCDSETKDQETDPPFRYVHITEEKERINRWHALSGRCVGDASDGRKGVRHRQFGGPGIKEHGGFFVVIIINSIEVANLIITLIEFIDILGMVAVLIVKSATPDCSRSRTVEGVAPFSFSR